MSDRTAGPTALTFITPADFLEMDHQEQAVTAARKILEAHSGVFIADVVGLGKTYVTALVLQRFRGRTLVVCPPVLADYWRETFVDFGVRGYRIESLGRLDHMLRDGHEKYDRVVLDEAHRFRYEMTQRYEKLHEIAVGKAGQSASGPRRSTTKLATSTACSSCSRRPAGAPFPACGT